MMENKKVVQVPKEHYDIAYDHKARWLSYWYQIRSVLSFSPKSILEVGLGNGLVRNYLSRQGIEVTTLDIDERLNPDIVGSVTGMPLEDNSFDVVLAAQVLEHLPFDQFNLALSDIHRVCSKGAMISLPDARRTIFRGGVHIPKVGWKDVFFKAQSNRVHKFDGQHYWEIGKKDYPLDRICKEMRESGFDIVRDFVPPDVPTKHFFILKKKRHHRDCL